MDYEPDLAPLGDPGSAVPSERVPRIPPEAAKGFPGSESLIEALWFAAEVFRVPLTNNIPRFEQDDPDQPIYHVGDFIEVVRASFIQAGWRPPEVTLRHGLEELRDKWAQAARDNASGVYGPDLVEASDAAATVAERLTQLLATTEEPESKD